ncbi:hypothetical protein WA1_29620 [Scytonema hofmannii PCC 7110]|uniref:Uncharacterized protein n=1 Tax=Scytonema hofmannii PCC 7110 TaxID=128403 RepID=A0A139X5Y4_9CYAN|nr:hypothetical protein [Scytonema hofmannii]KYC40108.1 hypothetical protein WA1_29620 [Scytonema hofmannii PCC 7110]
MNADGRRWKMSIEVVSCSDAKEEETSDRDNAILNVHFNIHSFSMPKYLTTTTRLMIFGQLYKTSDKG